MTLAGLAPVANHIWQSTLFASAAWLATLWLRGNRARVRHWVWAAASLKFFVPFAALVALGGQVHWRRPESRHASAPIAVAIERASVPFVAASPGSRHPAAGVDSAFAPEAAFTAWALGVLGISVVWFVRWRRIARTVQASVPMELSLPVRALAMAGRLEPGVFGVFRPLLLLPADLDRRLTPQQFDAVLAHELCHVRHRDNLIAALHMLVETLFWFHPLVWWMGKRMLAERELACDEEVVSGGADPAAYAHGILNVCKLYVESPLACAAGVTGGALRRRIEAILRRPRAARLSLAKRAGLAVAASVAIAAPFAIGVFDAPPMRAQAEPPRPKFEVASVKPCDPSPGQIIANPTVTPGHLTIACVPLTGEQSFGLIQRAYVRYAGGHPNPFHVVPIVGAPSWANTALFQIDAKAAGNPGESMMFGPMLQTLLEDRFQLRLHRETIEGPVYELTNPKGASKLQAFDPNTCVHPALTYPPPELSKGQRYCRTVIFSQPPAVQGEGATIAEFLAMLNMVVDRPVIDKTGITGRHTMRVEFARDESTPGLPRTQAATPPAEAADPKPDIFQAIEQQLGLKLTRARGPIERIVIDHIEKPTQN